VSSITDESAVITLEVKLVSSVTGGEEAAGRAEGFFEEVPDDIFGTVKQLVNESVEDAVEDALEEEGIDAESLKNLSQNLRDLDNKALGNLKSFASSPDVFVENQFLSILSRAGPQGAIIASIITMLLASPELVKGIITMLGPKGGILNQDFRFSQEAQYDQEFNRLLQFNRLTGDDPVITFLDFGFVAVSDPDFRGNSLVDANEARSGRVGLKQSAFGYVNGV